METEGDSLSPDTAITPGSLGSFIRRLRLKIERGDKWVENGTLDGFLEAMEAWLHDSSKSSPDFLRERGLDEPRVLRAVATVLVAGARYE